MIILAIAAGLGALGISMSVAPVIFYAEDDDDAGEDDPQDINTDDIVLETHNATMISTIFTTLNGELVDMGNYSLVEVYFVWSERSGEYTNETPKQTMTSPGEFSAEISDLFMPDNTYYFQARSDPEGMGEEVSFYIN